MDKIYQCRYYGTLETGESNPKNYPTDITANMLKTNAMPLFNSQGVTRLEVQGDPGTVFWIGIDGKPAFGPLFLGITGVYSLDLQADQKLTHFHIGPNADDIARDSSLAKLVNAIDNVDKCWAMDIDNNTHWDACLTVTVTY